MRRHAAQFQLAHRCFESLSQPFAAHFLKIAVDGVALRHGELGEWIVDGVELEVAALGNLHGALQHIGRIFEKEPHFVGALDEELVAVELEAVGVVNLGAGLHAKHHFMRVTVFAAQVMRVVGSDQGNLQFALQSQQIGANLSFLVQPLVLNFEIEIPSAEDVLVLLRGSPALP